MWLVEARWRCKHAVVVASGVVVMVVAAMVVGVVFRPAAVNTFGAAAGVGTFLRLKKFESFSQCLRLAGLLFVKLPPRLFII